MKTRYKLIAISVIAISSSIIILKNYYIQFVINKKLSSYHLTSNYINCSGLYKINCKLNNLNFSEKLDDTIYSVNIEDVYLKDILSIYSLYTGNFFYNDTFEVSIQNLKIQDDKNILKELAQPLNIFSTIKNTNLYINMKNYKLDIKINSKSNELRDYIINTEIKNNYVKNVLYELYILKYLEIKKLDGIDFAKGINISLGIPSDNIIDKKDFFIISIPRLITLIISEIESNELINKYNRNKQISKIIREVLTENGKRNFYISLP